MIPPTTPDVFADRIRDGYCECGNGEAFLIDDQCAMCGDPALHKQWHDSFQGSISLPILKRFGTWVVTAYGVECISERYCFPGERSHEADWERHMVEKGWCHIPDFLAALEYAKQLWPPANEALRVHRYAYAFQRREQLIVPRCPYCLSEHAHGGGRSDEERAAGRHGWRGPHCVGLSPSPPDYLLVDDRAINGFGVTIEDCNWRPTMNSVNEVRTDDLHQKDKHVMAADRNSVTLFKDGDAMGIKTTATTEEQFWTDFAQRLAASIEHRLYNGDWEHVIQAWSKQAFEIAAKLRGYKSTVVEERVLYSGAVFADDHVKVSN